MSTTTQSFAGTPPPPSDSNTQSKGDVNSLTHQLDKLDLPSDVEMPDDIPTGENQNGGHYPEAEPALTALKTFVSVELGRYSWGNDNAKSSTTSTAANRTRSLSVPLSPGSEPMPPDRLTQTYFGSIDPRESATMSLGDYPGTAECKSRRKGSKSEDGHSSAHPGE